MANILKEGKTYTDVRGVIYNNAYMVVDQSQSRALPPGIVLTVNIYKDSVSRLVGLQPILSTSLEMNTTNIVTYIGTPKDANVQEVPLDFLKKWIYRFIGTEMPSILGVVWSDWKSDENGGIPQTKVIQ
jgi:hypothetical protein